MNKCKYCQAQITKLRQEKEQLRLFLHEIIEAYYRVVNGPDHEDEKAKKEEEDE